jgi:hypothetical protein
MAVAFTSVLLPIVRVGAYVVGYAPPLNIYARVVLRRFLIPGYDEVFIAPLIAVLVGSVGSWFGGWCGVNFFVVTGPITAAVSLFIVLGLGPDFATWRLTGNHRIIEGNVTGLIKVG